MKPRREPLPGGWILGAALSRSGEAVIYEATDAHGVALVVKRLRERGHEAGVRARREAKALAATAETEATVRVRGVGRDRAGYPFLVVDRAPGVAVSAALSRGETFGEMEACAIVQQVCEALTPLHRLGAIHTQILPGNILLAEDRSRVTLVGFGAVRDVQGLLATLETELAVLPGADFADESADRVSFDGVEYLAPELLSELRDGEDGQEVGTWSDVFGLGCLFFTLLTGLPPFDLGHCDGNLGRYLSWRATMGPEEIPPLRQVPPALYSVIKTALNPEPRLRQPDARVFQADLIRYLTTGMGVAAEDVTMTLDTGAPSIIARLMPERLSPIPALAAAPRQPGLDTGRGSAGEARRGEVSRAGWTAPLKVAKASPSTVEGPRDRVEQAHRQERWLTLVGPVLLVVVIAVVFVLLMT